MRRNEKRKKNDVANRYVSDEETQEEAKQDEEKKFETFVLSLVVPVPELAHVNNLGLDYAASNPTTDSSKPNSLLKWLRLNSA